MGTVEKEILLYFYLYVFVIRKSPFYDTFKLHWSDNVIIKKKRDSALKRNRISEGWFHLKKVTPKNTKFKWFVTIKVQIKS